MRYVKKTFQNQNIHIDEDEYESCRFQDCRIIFTGKGPARFANCKFDECQWVFDDAAEETIQYLAALYTGLGAGGRALVEAIFQGIREGGVGHGTLVPGPSAAALRR
ncbi:MAG TPA: hypothetical protein VFX03_04445 [Thermomicrobiales bacterium]|nr:hypothetical protein [Thermomicrobiales bacterium]